MIEKLDELKNIFAPVTSDSPQCDLEIMAVKKTGRGRQHVDDGNENYN